jgi:glutathione peroxidase
MNVRQWILKTFYPLLMKASKGGKRGAVLENKRNIIPPVSFYSLSVTLNNGEQLDFKTLKNKRVLIVNTASNCGYTSQYNELQKLYEESGQYLEILGFPANDFKEQEKGNDEEIAAFCQVNFGVTFPLAKKSKVIKGPGQNVVFDWLTNASKNGWNNHQPDWNFSKYIVSESGILLKYAGPSISPLDLEL